MRGTLVGITKLWRPKVSNPNKSLPVAQLSDDYIAGLSLEQRIAVRSQLMRVGLLDTPPKPESIVVPEVEEK
jgi:hypothetical protein